MMAAKVLQSRGHAAEAWRLFADLRQAKWARPDVAPAWDGEPLDGKTLLVADADRQIVPLMRMARFLGPAAERVAKVVALTDPRLVAPLQRTFPTVDVRAHGDDEALPPVDFVASYDRLGQHLLGDRDARDGFVPLLADPERVARFRQAAAGGGPRIGIAWHSTNDDKALPALGDWAAFMAQTNPQFVSLQYREDEFGFAELEERSGGKLARVEGVSHFHDIDAHFAAIASVDLLVSISNTTAHAAGCLGVPVVVLLDEGQVNMHWAAQGEADWFFPSAHLLRRAGRPWGAVFEEAERAIDRLGR